MDTLEIENDRKHTLNAARIALQFLEYLNVNEPEDPEKMKERISEAQKRTEEFMEAGVVPSSLKNGSD